MATEIIQWLSNGLLTLADSTPAEIVHYTLMCMMMREDYPEVHGRMTFSRRHPLACYTGSMLLCFAGVILANSFIGQPALSPETPFVNSGCIFKASIVWYLIHFVPFDFVYQFCSLLPIKLIIVIVKEIHRSGTIVMGFSFVAAKFPHSYFISALYTVLRGTGSMQMRIVQRLVCGVWSPVSVEFLKPSLTSKMSTCAAMLLALQLVGILPVSVELVHLLIISGFICVKLAFFLRRLDCFAICEQWLCYFVFGGLSDRFEDKLKDQRQTQTHDHEDDEHHTQQQRLRRRSSLKTQ